MFSPQRRSELLERVEVLAKAVLEESLRFIDDQINVLPTLS